VLDVEDDDFRASLIDQFKVDQGNLDEAGKSEGARQIAYLYMLERRATSLRGRGNVPLIFKPSLLCQIPRSVTLRLLSDKHPTFPRQGPRHAVFPKSRLYSGNRRYSLGCDIR
jgi:hypothetical protein